VVNPLMSVTQNMTRPYNALEAWGYDTFIAPAVLDMARAEARVLAAGLAAEGELLDVGCGGGQLVDWLAGEFPRLRLTGVDLSDRQIARAERRVGGRAAFKVGSALDLPFAGDSFDAVVSVASIKHWPDPLAGMREILRVLKPGGVFFVAEADRGCKLADARRFVDSWRVPPPAKPLLLPLFRTFVAGNGLDLDDGRELLRALGVAGDVRRLPGKPGLLVTGKKR
jgi:ubiquinone/menaquinone biosynthesis C-methylase UbiE